MVSITEEELNYIATIYKHGISHLIDDTIPNRILCIHNLHWCVENLLRKATKDYDLNFKAGFEKIFKKFISKGHNPPENIKKSILKLNNIRNNIEHREIYPDISVIRKIIPDVENFIKWILEKIFEKTIDLISIPSVDEGLILKHFKEWIEQKLNFDTNLNDYLFFCLIPSTYANNLIDLSINGIEQMESKIISGEIEILTSNPHHRAKIEHYFSGCQRLFGNSQIYSVPTHFKYINENYGNEIKIFSDGRIYTCIFYNKFNPNNPTFNIELLYKKNEVIIIKEHSEKYGLPIKEYHPYNLEDLLKIICFSFHPDCKEKLVYHQTKYFRGHFILPRMRFKGKDRILKRNNYLFDTFREYAGDKDYIYFSKTFHYDEISDLVIDFKNWVYSFFKNKQSTAFLN
ncbi:MAG: hypothetical protein ACTSQP_19850 [Promethearchaeota archaeon]